MDQESIKEIGHDEYVDWRGRKLEAANNGGIMPALVICVVEILEALVFTSNASNIVSYFRSMNYSIPEASNMVTNFMGTTFLLTILGGLISDSFITRFWAFILFGLVELLGIIMLTVQASIKSLKPVHGHLPSSSQEAFLYFGLYAMAVGAGGVKATLQAHGADQLDKNNQPLISSFFNWFFFSITVGALISCTVMVWVEENKSWTTAFHINIGVFSLALFIFISAFSVYRNKRPSGSPFTRIYKVLSSSIQNRKNSWSRSVITQNSNDEKRSAKFKWLDKAMANDAVSQEEVEETRTFIGLLPIFVTTIIPNCCVAQLATFSVQQGLMMNRKLGHNFEVPPPSLSVIPLTVILLTILLYERLTAVLVKNPSEKSKNMFVPIKRMGMGLALTSGAMAVAAVVEVYRRNAAEDGFKLSVFWLGWQYLILGFADMLTVGSMLDFLYSEAPDSMKSMCTALAWCSTSLGFFLSSLLVSITNSVSKLGGKPWLGGKVLNQNRLEFFYTLLAVLNFISFLNYVFWSKRY